MGEEPVPEPFTFMGVFDEAGNIDKLDRGLNDLFRLEKLRQSEQSPVGDRNDAHVRIDRAKGIWLAGNGKRCQCIENS